MTTSPVSFYIHRKGKAHGPCSLEELRTYLAYGSVKPDELVAEAGSDHWQPARQIFLSPVQESAVAEDGPSQGLVGWLQQRWQERSRPADEDELQAALATRRRIVRYRDWEKVPHANRSTTVLQRILLGFCIFPPTLWFACSTVLSSRVVRRSADEHGYLKTWPNGMQGVCTFLIALNAVVWGTGIYLAVQYAGPTASEAAAAFMDSAGQFVEDTVMGHKR